MFIFRLTQTVPLALHTAAQLGGPSRAAAIEKHIRPPPCATSLAPEELSAAEADAVARASDSRTEMMKQRRMP